MLLIGHILGHAKDLATGAVAHVGTAWLVRKFTIDQKVSIGIKLGSR